MLKMLTVAGARPNFMKIAPLHRAMVATGSIKSILLHTGQHYDENMSQVFLNDFGLPKPDFELGVGSGTHAAQTARVMLGIEPVIERVRPDCVLVVGDVNSTIAATLTAAKLGVPTGHVEAGLRSFDRSMPEEINRILTDAITDLLFAPSPDAVVNLRREGISDARVFFVGNVMIDTLFGLRERADGSTVVEDLNLVPGRYVLSTFHRPSNVDNEFSLKAVVGVLTDVSRLATVVLVAHPRTRERLESFGMLEDLLQAGIRVVKPLGYIDFLKLLMGASVALTDSGGIQEETTVLGVPCVTMRTTTERPITVTQGTNRLVGQDTSAAVAAVASALDEPRRPHMPELWDGYASERIVQILLEKLS